MLLLCFFYSDAPPHSLRERPPGCRTAFVGGLPDNISEAILQEVFEKSGPIESIRLGSKHFAHIRFLTRHSVEEATYLSGTSTLALFFFTRERSHS